LLAASAAAPTPLSTAPRHVSVPSAAAASGGRSPRPRRSGSPSDSERADARVVRDEHGRRWPSNGQRRHLGVGERVAADAARIGGRRLRVAAANAI